MQFVHIFPGGIIQCFPTSGYSLTGCSPAEPVSASPDTCKFGWYGPLLSPPGIVVVSTGIAGLNRQTIYIKRFIVFQHGPGNNQYFGRQLNPHFGFDTALCQPAIGGEFWGRTRFIQLPNPLFEFKINPLQ